MRLSAKEQDLSTMLIERYAQVRRRSEALCAPLAIEDYVVQGRAEVSPPKWHLAHTSWFFEQFLLRPYGHDYHGFDPRFDALFNSYYLTVGTPFPRPERGHLSRPTVEEIYRYRAYVNAAMEALLATAKGTAREEIAARTELGLQHEAQHQELLLMDIKYNFAINPLRPAYHLPSAERAGDAARLSWIEFEGGLHALGAIDEGFAFDNERPRHSAALAPFALASRLVTNGEYLAFVEDGGYQRPEWWLADGWNSCRREQWSAPLYWTREPAQWLEMTLAGARALRLDEPVAHVSYFEAEAFARWAGKRLPLEDEWEIAAHDAPRTGNLLDDGLLHPQSASGAGLTQMIGDLWEWTASPYVAYPGYRRAAGPFGEYNGKFMCNQWVMRGGACVTPADHIRITYRNFFYPGDRWQFGGIRLAEDR